jgi:exonuclease III
MAECNVKLMSMNSRGLRNKDKRGTVFRYIHGMADVIFLQEMHCLNKDKSYWSNEWKGNMVLSYGTNDRCGVGILFKDSLEHKIINSVVDNNGRYILLRCLIQDRTFVLLNVYAPNREKEHTIFLQHILSKMIDFIKEEDEYFILGGDWNVTTTIDLDRMVGNPKLWQDSVNVFDNIQQKFDLLDIWRAKHPNTRRYTWRQSKPLKQSRIDYWLISDNLQPYIEKTDICPGIRSDHSAITIHIKTFKDSTPGRSYWKFNNTILIDPEYTTLLIDHLHKWEEENSDIPYHRVQCDYLKFKIAQFTRKYTKEKALIRRGRVQELEGLARFYEENLSVNENNIKLYEQVNTE